AAYFRQTVPSAASIWQADLCCRSRASGHCSHGVRPDAVTQGMSLATRRPVPADFASILAINSAAVPNVASLDESELKRLIGVGDLVLVAEDAGRIVGYLIGMLDTARYDGEEFQHFTRRAADSFLYIDQIAVLMHARHQGVGSHLYADAIRWSVERGIARLCCEVNL